MPVGRPREFDINKALDRAVNVFWRKGYEGASLEDLTKAMGISRPSLYAAFGNKEALFRKAIDRYADGTASYINEALEEPVVRNVVQRVILGAIQVTTGSRSPRGCLLVQGALACGDEAESVRRELARRRARIEARLRQRFERAISEGDLPSDADPADLARFVTAVIHGIAVKAADGAAAEDLKKVAELAMRAWPA